MLRLTHSFSRTGTAIVAALFGVAVSLPASGAINLRAGGGTTAAPGSSSSASSTSQTSTAATAATSQSAQTAQITQQAQASLQHSIQAMQALQIVQSAARKVGASTVNLGTSTRTLPTVLDGLTGTSGPLGSITSATSSGLVPGLSGVDATNPNDVKVSVPVTVNANGSASFSLTKNSAVTLPTSLAGSGSITVSGTGTVGTVTTGNTITAITAGVATMVAPGSTISLTTAGTVTVAGTAPGVVPTAISTYNYGTSLVPASVPSSWTGIGGLSQATYAPASGQSAGQTTVTVTQTSQQALLTWQTFNVGKNTVLDFDQSQGGANVGQWVAINKVAANIAPLQVLGAIQAPGQVYVINQNGIIFGGASQVNVGALVASSLPINDNLVQRGLLNNPDLQFLFSQVDESAGTLGPTPAFAPVENDSAPGAHHANGGTVVSVDTAGNVSAIAASGHDGDVAVEPGAQLSSLTNAESVGGRIALVGPNVTNAGAISTPDGQAILAAGLQVGFQNHNTNDPTLRGLDVYVGAVDSASGVATNAGLIGNLTALGQVEPTPGAGVTITGDQVNQLGLIDLSTSVSLNSRVDLLADYNAAAFFTNIAGFHGVTGFYPAQAGPVTLGPDSVTELTPDSSTTNTVVGSQLALSSLVNIQGSSITMGADALLLATSASNIIPPTNGAKNPTFAFDLTGIQLNAGVTVSAGQWTLLSGQESFYNSIGQISLGTGATIDVSGSENVAASVANNIVSAQLLGSELANSPLEQDSPLRGQTIEVDLRDVGVYNGTAWIGTPLADVSGYVNLVPHDADELTTNGGTVNLLAGQSVSLANGSAINVSGGWINYAGANVTTTKVITSSGQILDISQATPNLIYTGIYTGNTVTSTKWGTSQTTGNNLLNSAQYEAGYVQGGGAGAISITAPSMTLNGNLYGNSVAGAQQRALPGVYNGATSAYASSSFLPTLLSTLAVPALGSLSLNFKGQVLSGGGFINDTPDPVDVVFQSANGLAVTDPFATSGHAEINLSSNLVDADGFGNLTIFNPDGNFYVPTGVSLTATAGGSLAFSGANILIDGNLSAPGGTLAFTSYDFSFYSNPGAGVTPPANLSRGSFVLGSGASLSVAGLFVDDLTTTSSSGSVPLATTGGTLSIQAYNTDLVVGGLLDVSGGLQINQSGAISYGNAGSLTIKAGRDPNIGSLVGGQLTLDATLHGYSGATGGSLTLLAQLVQIGASANSAATIDPAHTLLLDPGFFSQGGFSNFTIQGLGEANPAHTGTDLFLPSVSVSSGVTIDPVVSKWVATVQGNEIVLTPTVFPLASERSPAHLTFAALDVTDASGTIRVPGDFVLGANASIVTDPLGKVSITGSTVELLGDITAPGGSIIIAGAKDSTILPFGNTVTPLVTVEIGSGSTLSVAGVVQPTLNTFGYSTGSVLSGGSISITGNILAENGSVLNVSGTSGLLDVLNTGSAPSANLHQSPYTLIDESSSGGSITLAGGQILYTEATLLGAAGGPTSEGGSLTLSSGIFNTSNSPTTPLDVNLAVVQSGATFVSPAPGQDVIGTSVTPTQPLLDSDGSSISAYFAADPNIFSAVVTGTGNGGRSGGFDALTLSGTVEFSGSVSIAANRSIKVGSSGVIEINPAITNSAVTLTAPYVAIGQPFQGPLTLIQQEESPYSTIYVDSNSDAVEIAPTYAATETLAINASVLADVGNLSLQNVGQLNFNATPTAGDIRGDGTLDAAGTINLKAAQIYPPTETTFTIAAYDIPGQAGSGTINITAPAGQTLPQLPLSAGVTLNIFASNIVQGGVLRAPIGTINLGSGVTSASPVDPLSGQTFATTQNLTLAAGSVTSVSAVDPVTHQDLTIPYGTIVNGTSWIDPAGNNITVAGNGANAVPAKAVNLSAAHVTDSAGATIDISGGGDLYAYQFVSGTSGTVDILASSTSFAILPGYTSTYAPVGAYNTAESSANAYNPSGTVSDGGYVNSTLTVGDQITIAGGDGLAAGTYTLLPARYALLPGAYLITPQSGTPVGTSIAQLDGSVLVAGYTLNGLSGTTQTSPALLGSYDLASLPVVESRAEYTGYSANTFLQQSAVAQGKSVLVPLDAGQLVLAATSTMIIEGTVQSQATQGGIGGQVDIASTSNILISGPNTDVSGDVAGLSGSTLVLDSSDLSAFGADSLLIGGYRTPPSAGEAVTVLTSHVLVDNAGASTVVNGTTIQGLGGPDVILASKATLTLASGAEIEQTGTLSSSAETLVLGSATTAGSGDGTLIRVSSDSSAGIIRNGVTASTSGPKLTLSSGATITGAGLILDSTSASSLASSASLSGKTISINSGQINLVLDNSAPASGLVLSSSVLAGLQNSAQALSLLSYTSIDLYGSGEIGRPADSSGNYPIQSFALHAGQITDKNGGTVTINAQRVTLDNSGGSTSPDATVTRPGGLVVNAGVIQLGGGSGTSTLDLNGYAAVQLNAANGVVLAATSATMVQDASGNPVSVKGSAALETAGNLTITTPLIVGATGSDETINATGTLTVTSTGSTATVTGGLGGILDLTGSSVTVDSTIVLPSGDISIQANGPGGNVVVDGELEVYGKQQSFNDVFAYTSAGKISLISSSGSVILNSSGTISVAANAGGGNGGQLTVSAANGTFDHDGSLLGQGGAGGQGGSFSVDVATEDVSSALNNGTSSTNAGNDLTPLETLLNTGGFTQAQSIRVRGGIVNGLAYNDVYVGGNTTANEVHAGSFTLSADQGSLIVTGTIDASNVAATDADGNTIYIGGSINLVVGGNLILDPTAVLNASAQNFNNAGQGGSVTLVSGAYRSVNGTDVTDYSGSVDIQGNSTSKAQINLSVAYLPIRLNTSGTSSVSLASAGTILFPDGTPGDDQITSSSAGVIRTSSGSTNTFAAGAVVSVAAGSSITLNAPGTIAFAPHGTGGAIVMNLPSSATFSSVGATNLEGGAALTAAAQGDFSGTLQITAPRIGETGVEVNPINGTILGASSIAVVGNQVYSTANYGDNAGTIDGNVNFASDITTDIMNDGNTFLGTAGQSYANYTNLAGVLFGNLGAASQSVANLEVGAEVVNPTGNITLNSDWDLSVFRFGPNSAPGVLTMRAAGNLIFNGTLSDGFTSSDVTGAQVGSVNYAVLMEENPLLPGNQQSWSYNLTAGADLSAANFSTVVPNTETYDPATGLAVPGTAGGSLELGVFAVANNGTGTVISSDGQAGETANGLDQSIRSGTGNINIAVAGDVLLQNQFATIYTAGVQVPTIAHFDLPILSQSGIDYPYPAQYSLGGGNVTISAQGNIAHVTFDQNKNAIIIDSEKQLPTNWLYRRGYVVQSSDPTAGTGLVGGFGVTENGDIASTTWWIDFSNFFEGVGALGGGNVILNAGHDVSNVDAVVPTTAQVPYENALGSFLAANQTAVELGGGNLLVLAGNDINAGAYYVERGQGTLEAGNSIITNYTRSPSTGSLTSSDPITGSDAWLPTTLFLGDGSFDVTAQDNLLLGPVANPFLLPQGLNNTYWDKTYFSTYASTDAVNVSSLTGTVTLRTETTPIGQLAATPLLQLWIQAVEVLGTATTTTVATDQPWVETTETLADPFVTVDALQPPALAVTAFSGDIDLVGNLTLSPSPTGNLSLLAAGSFNGLQPNGVGARNIDWSSATIILSDTNPTNIPGVDSPFAYENVVGTTSAVTDTSGAQLSFLDSFFAESGSTEGTYGVLQTKQELHASINNAPLHANDAVPVRLYASSGDISGLTLYSGKQTQVSAGQDITDVALYLQNNNANDVSIVSSGRDIVAYDANAPLLIDAQSTGNGLNPKQGALSGDIQIAGPGTLEVLAGRNLNLGDGPNLADGTGVGISSIGNQSNPVLPFAGANIVSAAGLTGTTQYNAFISEFLTPDTALGNLYLPDLGTILGLPNASETEIKTAFNALPADQQQLDALDLFYLILRDSGRDHSTGAPGDAAYENGNLAIATLFPDSATDGGDLSLTSREIKTTNGGNISILVPGGQLNVGLNVSGVQPVDQGILTEDGGNISIFTKSNVNVGTSRIFTLNGGNEIIWSTYGNIDAGASSKTVQSAPPTRVLVDPQSGAVQIDLAGLATGGGIGVLETRKTSQAADVDLIAPKGVVNAGDAGIRASGNLNIAAVQVLNAGNIQVGGKSSGVPVGSSVNVAGIAAAGNVAGAAQNSASELAQQQVRQQNAPDNSSDSIPSLITVEVIGYGGSAE